MLVSVIGILNGEGGNRMHILPLVNVTLSGISIYMFLERLVVLLKEEGNNNCTYLCDMEGYMLYVDVTKSVFRPILEYIQIHRERNLANFIRRGMNVR